MYTRSVSPPVTTAIPAVAGGTIRRSPVQLAAAALCLIMLHEPGVSAAQFVDYLGISPPGMLPSPNVFSLPGYGNVLVTTNLPSSIPVTFLFQSAAANGTAGPYQWGADTNRFNIFNTTAGNESYSLNFTFLSGAPNPSYLLLVVAGLASGTTATVSSPGSSSQPGTLVTEFHFASSDLACGATCPGGSSPTNFDPSTLTFSSGYTGNSPVTDILNTGWAFYQTNSDIGPFTTLSLNVDQISGDGIGFTLRLYRRCRSPLPWRCLAQA